MHCTSHTQIATTALSVALFAVFRTVPPLLLTGVAALIAVLASFFSNLEASTVHAALASVQASFTSILTAWLLYLFINLVLPLMSTKRLYLEELASSLRECASLIGLTSSLLFNPADRNQLQAISSALRIAAVDVPL